MHLKSMKGRTYSFNVNVYKTDDSGMKTPLSNGIGQNLEKT
jgi:hypothetical protein